MCIKIYSNILLDVIFVNIVFILYQAADHNVSQEQQSNSIRWQFSPPVLSHLYFARHSRHCIECRKF